MEMINNSENKSSRRDYHRIRTLQVLEKWGIEGEINQYNIRNAASSYARIQLKNQVMKWVAIGAVVFLAVFMGLMIGSVVLGIEATKDFKVKDQMIMSRSGNSPLKTTEKVYFTTLKLTTPLSVIQGIKSLRFDTQTKDGKKEYIEFEVVSFYYSTGRNLTLYGHTHMANVMGDGSVEIVPVTTVSGAKRYDSSLKKRTTDATATTTNQSTSTSTIIGISTCEQFINIGSIGSYALLGDIDCGNGTFLPIQNFGGFLNGNMHTVKINIDAQQGEGGVFSRLLSGAIISNTNFEGSVVGSFICGGVAARSDSNVILFTLNVYTSVVCNTKSSSSQVIAGGVIGGLQNYIAPRGVVFSRIAAQGKVNVVTSTPSSSYVGGIYGVANIPDYRIHLINLVSGTFIVNLANNFNSTNSATNAPTVDPSTQINTSLFGFRSSSPVSFDNFKRNIVPKTVDINYCESNQEGIDWYWAWVFAYDDILNHRNTTAETQLHDNNTALCVYYYYHHNNAEAQCCRDFGITYDCFQQFCPNTLAFGYPCMICRPKGARNVRDTPVGVINGKLVSYFQSYEDAPRYFFNRPSCATS